MAQHPQQFSAADLIQQTQTPEGRKAKLKRDRASRDQQFAALTGRRDAEEDFLETLNSLATKAREREDQGGQRPTGTPVQAPPLANINQPDPGRGLGGEIAKLFAGLDDTTTEETTPGDAGAGGRPAPFDTVTTKQTSSVGPPELQAIAGFVRLLGKIADPDILQNFGKVTNKSSKQVPSEAREKSFDKSVLSAGESLFNFSRGNITEAEHKDQMKRAGAGLDPQETIELVRRSQANFLSMKGEAQEKARDSGREAFPILLEHGIQNPGVAAGVITKYYMAVTEQEIEESGKALGEIIYNGDKLRTRRAAGRATTAAAARQLTKDEKDDVRADLEIARARVGLREDRRKDEVGTAEHARNMGQIRALGIKDASGLTGTATEQDLDNKLENLTNSDGSVQTEIQDSIFKVQRLQAGYYRLGLPAPTVQEEGIILKDNVLRRINTLDLDHNLRVLSGREQGDRAESVLFLDAHGLDFFDLPGGRTIPGAEELGAVMPGPGAPRHDFAFDQGTTNDAPLFALAIKAIGNLDRLETEDGVSIDNWRTHEGDSPGLFERDQRQGVREPTPTALRNILGVGGTGGPQLGGGQEQFLPTRTPGRAAAEDLVNFVQGGGAAVARQKKLRQEQAVEELRQPRTSRGQQIGTNITDFLRELTGGQRSQ